MRAFLFSFHLGLLVGAGIIYWKFEQFQYAVSSIHYLWLTIISITCFSLMGLLLNIIFKDLGFLTSRPHDNMNGAKLIQMFSTVLLLIPAYLFSPEKMFIFWLIVYAAIGLVVLFMTFKYLDSNLPPD